MQAKDCLSLFPLNLKKPWFQLTEKSMLLNVLIFEMEKIFEIYIKQNKK